MNCEKIFQWDVNSYVSVPDGIRYVDYDTEPVTRVEVSDGKARIPDEILETSGLKLMWFCVDDHTRYLYNLEVRPRPVPPDHATTPTETITFATLVERVESLADGVESAVAGAENVNITSEQTSDGIRVTTTDRNGEETVVEVKGGGGSGYDDTEIRQEIAELNDKKVGYSEVSDGVLMMYSDETKSVLLAELDLPGGGSTDVRIDGTSITQDGVADIPVATNSSYGVVKSGLGLYMQNGAIRVYSATANSISSRAQGTFVPTNLSDDFVRIVLTDGKGQAWTEEEQKAAQLRLGILSSEEVLFG